jgi:CRP-like cAMP-binding protein
MAPLNQPSVQNLLLANIPETEFESLRPHLEWVDLKMHDKLVESNGLIEHAYFPTAGICSMIAVASGGVKIETGLIGKEGFVGSPIVLSVDRAPYEIVVQAVGRALRMSRGDLQAIINLSPAFNALLLRFIHLFTIQTAQTALANGRCTVDERLARWLLMCHDRVESNEFPITHEFLSVMLAVRRSSVTDALHILESRRLIQSSRGSVKILNRPGLELAAGGAYGVPESEYERLISPLHRHASPENKA